MNREQILRQRIKLLTWVFIGGLVLSGATAIPLTSELDVLVDVFGADGKTGGNASSELARWL